LLRPLPVADADRLVVFGGQQQGGDPFNHFSYPDFNDIRAQAGGLSQVLAYTITLAGLESEGRTEPMILSYVSGNYFQALGLNPYQGRLIYGQETEKLGTENVIVLGYGYWKKRFNSDPSIVGKQVKMNGHPVTVIGITPESFHGTYALVDMQGSLPLGMRTLWAQSTDKNDQPNEY